MSVTITPHATLVAALATTGGGTGGVTSDEIVLGSNCVHEISGVFYVVVLDASHHFQMYASTDSGATWATSGSAFTPTLFGGGMSSFIRAGKIWLVYSKGFTGPDQHLYINTFDPAGPSWGTETVFDCGDGDHGGTGMRIEGPYASHQRPDGSIVFIVGDTLTAFLWAVIYDGTFHGPYQMCSTIQLFESSAMAPDGTVHAIYGTGYNPSVFKHQLVNTDNSIGSAVTITWSGGANILSWSDMGLEYGFESSGSLYLACGRKQADYPTIWGRPAILYGNDGTWVLGSIIDTDPAISDFSVYTCSLQKVNGSLIYYWRGVSSSGSNYIERVGYAPVGSHDTPADWTWTTIYDFSSPSPAVSGQSSPYTITLFTKGATTGLSQTSTSSRMIATITNSGGGLFVTYLFSVLVSSVVAAFHNTFE
jgi:hypothetical protein